MRHGARAAVLIGLCASAGACAAISGLDHIREDSCVPDGCEASADDALAGDDTAADTQLAPDTSGPRDGQGDQATDASSPEDAGETGNTQEAAVDVWLPAEAEADSSPGDALPTDTGGADHQDAQTPGDAADCGSPDDPDHCGSCETRCGTCAGVRSCSGGVCAGGTVYFYEPFTGGAPQWKLDSTWTATTECASPPTPDKGYPDPTTDHTSGTAGGGVVGAYVCGNNPRATTTTALYATSPAVDVSAAPTLVLTFYRWLNSDNTMYMTSTVDVFDGSAWQNVYQNPSSALVTDKAWTKEEYDVSPYENAHFRVRFGYSIVSSSVYAMSCWNVDDVTLSTSSCP
jgi:hypothetical protein